MSILSNYYHILELSPGASLPEIRRAFHTKAKLLHPDINPSPDAHFEFIRLKEAFDVLSRTQLPLVFKMHHPSRDPYFQKPFQQERDYHHAGEFHVHKKQAEEINLFNTLFGKILYSLAHLVFAAAGVLIIIIPLLNTINKQFDPEKPLRDSIFAGIVTVIFGLIMIVIISGSYFSYLRKHH